MAFAMALDNSLEIMNEEGMYDVNGDGALYTWMVSAPIDIILNATGMFAAFVGVKLLGKFFGKKAAKSLSEW